MEPVNEWTERSNTTAKNNGLWPRRWKLAAALTAAVVTWEYLLNAVMNPEVAWSYAGVAFHVGLDLLLVLPLLVLALTAGKALARRLGVDSRREDFGGKVLGRAGAVALAAVLVMLPWTATRDLVHEWLGTASGFYLAEVEFNVTTSELTVKEAAQLCSFGSVRNPSTVRGSYQDFETTVVMRLEAGLRDALIQQAALLPLLMLGFGALSRRRPERRGWAPLVALLRTRSLRLGGLGALAAGALFCVGYGFDPQGSGSVAHATLTVPETPYNACTDGGDVKEYHVSAIPVTITLNRWGDHVTQGSMYALDANIGAIRAFEAALDADRGLPEVVGDPGAVTRVSAGLRQDPIQPLVLRANLGECLRVHFTNALEDGAPASMHILGLPHTAENAASAVGDNPDTTAAPGATVVYEIPIPLDAEAERAYYFHDHGAGRRRQNMGLFGAIVAEPRGATYLDVETGQALDTATGSNWEAIIVDPNLDGQADGKSFREFVVFYHEIGDEAFTDIRDNFNKKLPLVDEIAGVYRPAARALNYRSEPFRRRLEVEKTGKALGYSSYPFGDPATPIPRSYSGEATKTRLLHGGSEVFHVHHLHGGGDRWRRNPNADPANDFWKGLTKVPDPNLTSIHLDSQSIGPGTSYNLEHECGAGGCQQGVGDFLFHCHIGHHYISGMWSFWRVFGTVQTAETNVNGNPLAIVPDLYQADNPFPDAPSNTPPADAVSAGGLIAAGVTFDDGTPVTAANVMQFIAGQLPPPGQRLDKFDATVWDWTVTGSGAGLQIWGEPESDEAFPGYVSSTPGQRPEVLFNPKNGRYVWPLFRPQMGQRPPFTARHTGAPWLGERQDVGRVDGLCARQGVQGVDLGGTAVQRYYPVSSITLPIQVTPDKVDEDGQIFVLNEHEQDIRSGKLPANPLAIRSNVGDCTEILFTNKIPDGPLNKQFSKTNIHSHFVQFDTQASDGVITGFSYEQAVRPIASEGRFLTVPAGPGDTVLRVNHTDRLRAGIWLGVGLGEATCGVSSEGQPLPCTEIRKITALTADTITLDQPLVNGHDASAAVGVEFVRYNWYSDVDFGTVFFHTHVEFKDWDHGLFGTHIVEPKGSTYHDPRTGDEVRAGTLVDVRVDPAAGGNPVAFGVDGSFREFMLFLHNNSPVEGRFFRGGGNINLRAEPWRLRDGEAAHRFSSVTHGDPHTPLVRAYAGDPIVVRGMGLVERVGGVRFTGHRFNMERYTDQSDVRDTTFIGISERFDVSLEGGAGGPMGFPGDYLYYSTLGRDFESGAWGILRVHDTAQSSLQQLPDRDPPAAGNGFPQLTETGGAPPPINGSGKVCPPDAPVKEYRIEIDDTKIVYNRLTPADDAGVVYRLRQASDYAHTPLVMRVNVGDCLKVRLRNSRDQRSSISVGELLFDPQRSYGAAIGFNRDSTAAPGTGRAYEFYADRELGVVLGLNLGDVDSIGHGAFAAVVVEPEGSEYFRPGKMMPLPAGGVGIQADIVTNGVLSREFVALFNDQDRRIGQSAMPYPVGVERESGISYAREPLAFRDMTGNPAGVFKSSLWGDPRHVVTVPAGTPLTYRVAQPWGEQTHVPTLEGHRWLLEPGMAGSEQVYNDVLIPGMSLNLHFVGGAGGDIQAPGDYLFLDRRQPFLEAGLWNVLRVTGDGSSGGSDSVAILYTENFGSDLGIVGINSIRPAGDFAPTVTVYDGALTGEGCQGTVLGTARVDPGSGAWSFLETVGGSLGGEVCVASPGGGAASREVNL